MAFATLQSEKRGFRIAPIFNGLQPSKMSVALYRLAGCRKTAFFNSLLETLNEPPDSSAKLSDDYLIRRAMHHTALKEHLERLATNVSGDAEAEWSLIFVMDVLRKFLPLEQKWIDHNWKPGRRTEYDKDELHKMILRSAERLRKEDHKNLAAAVKADTNIEMSERHIRRIING